MRAKPIWVVLLVLTIAFFLGCQDTITDEIKEAVRLAKLPEYDLTIVQPAVGSVTPSGTIRIRSNEPLEISATAPGGYSFVNWVQTAGPGSAAFLDENAAATVVRLTGGDATITPVISSTIYTMTVTNDGNGSTNPSGNVDVADGQPRAISATANTEYDFDTWQQTGGAGTAVFANAGSAATTVTVTGGAVTIQAKFKLKVYAIQLTSSGSGTTSPSGTINLTHGVASAPITATPDTVNGYQFTSWQVTAGTGISFNPNAATATVTITATGGDATVQANFTLRTYTLNISAGSGGWVNPSGNRSVTHGIPFQLGAYPYGTYLFDNWTKTGGAGTVVFSPNASTAAATATVTGGDVSIRANFRKANVTLTEVGSLAFPPFTTYPEDGVDLYLYNNYLYILGRGGTSTTYSVVRRFSVASPTAPSSGSNDYRYVGGLPQALVGDGTYLFAGTNSTDGNIHRIAISGFGNSSTITNPSTATSVEDLAIYPASSSTLWVNTGSAVRDYSKSSLSGYYYNITDSSGWWFWFVEKTPFGLLAVQEDNGANQLAAYAVDAVSGATWTAPDHSLLLHNGYDMDPGNAGRIGMHPDGEIIAVPVYDPNDGDMLRVYDITDIYGVSLQGDADLSTTAKHVVVGDYYAYVAAEGAYVYVVDLFNPSAPEVRLSKAISSFGRADLVALSPGETYLYVVVDQTSAAKPTLKVFQIGQN